MTTTDDDHGDEVLLWVPRTIRDADGTADDETIGTPSLSSAYWEILTGDALVMSPDVVERQPLDNSVRRVDIGMLSAASIRGLPCANIHRPSGPPADMNHCDVRRGTIYDARMGHANSLGATQCTTCGLDYHNCPGHLGHIDLLLPIINPMFVSHLCHVLQTLCVVCCQLRISPFFLLAHHPLNPERATHEGRLRRLKDIAVLCARYPRCQFCHAGTLVFRQRGLCIQAAPVPKSTGEGAGFNGVPVPPGHICSILSSVPDFHIEVLGLNPTTNHPAHAVLTALVVMPPVARPTVQSTNSKTGQPFVVEDAVVGLYRQILQHNDALRTTHSSSAQFTHFLGIQHAYERLIVDQGRQYTVGAVTDRRAAAASNAATPFGGITKTAIRRRLVGKTGRVRREGIPKRVNFSMRTVATCCSQLAADEISIPLCMAAHMTSPVQVHPFNLQRLHDTMRRGGVLYTRSHADAPRQEVAALATWSMGDLLPTDTLLRHGRRWRLFRSNHDPTWATGRSLPLPTLSASDSPLPLPTRCVSHGLVVWEITALCRGDRLSRNGRRIDPCALVRWPPVRVGDILWPIPQDGDVVLVNRQPTLVQESMLAMRVRIERRPGSLSFGCSCAAMEAMRGDYDGDEINVHFPQDPRARAELTGLMAVDKQIVTGQAGRPVIRPIQDAVAAWFWLTHWPDADLGRGRFQQLAANLRHEGLLDHLRRVRSTWRRFCAVHPRDPVVARLRQPGAWEHSGLALFSLCLPEGFGSMTATAADSLMRHFVRADGGSNVLRIWEGILLEGPVTVATLGGKGGVLHRVALEHGARSACDFLTNIQCLASVATLYGYSLSVGLDDCLLPRALAEEAGQIMDRNVERLLGLPPDAGNAIERRISARAEAEAYLVTCMWRPGLYRRDPSRRKSLSNHNQMGLLCMLGTKGSISNYMQCTLCLGQQVIDGGLVEISDPSTFCTQDGRESGDRLLVTGLVYRDSFSRGLRMVAFYIHCTAGREAPVEPATNTSDSGYIMRLTVKMTERDIVGYDCTVRTEDGNIVQFAYNYNTGFENQWVRPDGSFVDVVSLLGATLDPPPGDLPLAP